MNIKKWPTNNDTSGDIWQSKIISWGKVYFRILAVKDVHWNDSAQKRFLRFCMTVKISSLYNRIATLDAQTGKSSKIQLLPARFLTLWRSLYSNWIPGLSKLALTRQTQIW